MRRVRIAAAVTFGGLALIIAVKLVLPAGVTVQSGHAATPPESIRLSGMLYDFRRSHPDFGLPPASEAGHYAGTVERVLDRGGRPVRSRTGHRVLEQCEDRLGRAIAPHVVGLRGGVSAETLGFRVDGVIELIGDAVVDAFDSNEGAYGLPGNFGRHALISTNSTASGVVRIDDGVQIHGDILAGPRGTSADAIEHRGHVTGRLAPLDRAFAMPAPQWPDDVEPFRPRIAIDAPTTLTGDLTPDDGRTEPALHCGEFLVSSDAVITVDGDLVLRCDERFDVQGGRIDLRPGATLTVYVRGLGGGNGDVRIREGSFVNTEGGNPARVRIFALGAGRLEIGDSHVYATIVAPARRLDVDDAGHLYGAFIGESLRVDRACGLHADLGLAAAGRSNHGLSVRESIVVRDHSRIDSFDSGEGPYDPAEPRSNAWVSTNASDASGRVHLSGDSTIRGVVSVGPDGDIDEIVVTDEESYVSGPVGRLAVAHPIPFAAAPDLGPSVGDRYFAGGVHRIHSDLRCRNLTLADGAIVDVLGGVTIRVDETLALRGRAEMRVDAGATLTVHVGGDVVIDQHSSLNGSPGVPRLASLRMTESGRIIVTDHSHLCAWVQGAGARLTIADGSSLTGSFAGRSVEIRGSSRLHVDTADLANCVQVFDAPGVSGPTGSGGLTSSETFADWFRPVDGTNEAVAFGLTLARGADGVYSYVDDAFYPLDRRWREKEGEAHNNNFTADFRARFRYEACGGQFVSFHGGDGAWLFIDGRLALDLGGVATRTTQHIDLDRLGLEDGRSYSFRLFTAQRRTGASVFRLRTNVELQEARETPALAARFE